jgi:hypothetical protein
MQSRERGSRRDHANIVPLGFVHNLSANAKSSTNSSSTRSIEKIVSIEDCGIQSLS